MRFAGFRSWILLVPQSAVRVPKLSLTNHKQNVFTVMPSNEDAFGLKVKEIKLDFSPMGAEFSGPPSNLPLFRISPFRENSCDVGIVR